MAGGGEAEAAVGGRGDGGEDGGDVAGLEALQLAVGPGEHLGGVVVLEGVGPKGGAEASHDDAGLEAVAGDVAEGEPEGAVVEDEGVVPVAADPAALGRDVAGGELEAGAGRDGGGEEAALEDAGSHLLDGLLAALDGAGDPAGDGLEEGHVVVVEAAPRAGTDVEHAEQAGAGLERDAEHGADAALPEERVGDGGGVDPLQSERPAGGGDPAGEADPDRDAHAVAHLDLDAAGRPGDELAGALVEQEDGGGVRVEQRRDLVEQVVEQAVDVEPTDGDVGRLVEGGEEGLRPLAAAGRHLESLPWGRRQTSRKGSPALAGGREGAAGGGASGTGRRPGTEMSPRDHAPETRRQHGAGVLRPMDLLAEPIWRRFWYPLAFAEDVGPVPLARHLLDRPLVLWRAGDGRPAAAVDRCPHRDGRLSTGWTCDGRIVCPYHGWQFGADGPVEVVPQLPEARSFPPRFSLEAVRAAERYGVVWVCLDEPVRPIPVLPDAGRPGWRSVREFDEEWAAAPGRLMENSFDPAHTVFVHRATFGDTSRPDVEVPSVERTEGGLVIRSDLSVANPADARAVTGETTQRTVRASETELHAPFVRVLRSRYPGGAVHAIVTAATPVGQDRLRLVQWAVRNDTEEEAPAAAVVAFDRKVTLEDRAVLEAIAVGYSPSLHANVHLKVDRPTVEIRRIYQEISAGTWAGLRGSPAGEPAEASREGWCEVTADALAGTAGG